MAVDGDEVDDDDDRDMLLLSLLLCWNAALQRCPRRSAARLGARAGCGKPVAAMACGRWLWKALATGAMLPRALLFSGTASADRT